MPPPHTLGEIAITPPLLALAITAFGIFWLFGAVLRLVGGLIRGAGTLVKWFAWAIVRGVIVLAVLHIFESYASRKLAPPPRPAGTAASVSPAVKSPPQPASSSTVNGAALDTRE